MQVPGFSIAGIAGSNAV